MSDSKEPKFKLGDKVKVFGCVGVVLEISDNLIINEPWLRVHVCIETGEGPKYLNFTDDGKQSRWHKEPSLVLVERAKTKVKLYPALIRLGSGQYVQTEELYRDEADAKSATFPQFIRLLTDDHHAVEVEEC
jgi:hypothetical protein